MPQKLLSQQIVLINSYKSHSTEHTQLVSVWIAAMFHDFYLTTIHSCALFDFLFSLCMKEKTFPLFIVLQMYTTRVETRVIVYIYTCTFKICIQMAWWFDSYAVMMEKPTSLVFTKSFNYNFNVLFLCSVCVHVSVCVWKGIYVYSAKSL